MESTLRFLTLSILAQGCAFMLSSLLLDPLSTSIFIRLFFPIVVASLLCHAMNFPRGWKISNAFFPIILFLSVSGVLPSWVFLLVAIFIAAFHLPAVWTRVPYYPTPKEVYERISDLIPAETSIRFLDIGCGMGDLLVYLAQKHPKSIFEGVELAWAPFFISSFKAIFRSNLRIRYKNLRKVNFSNYDLVYAFLSPAPMELIGDQLLKSPPSIAFISNSFPIPQCAGEKIEISTVKGGTIYIYR